MYSGYKIICIKLNTEAMANTSFATQGKLATILFSFVFLLLNGCDGDKNDMVFESDEQSIYESEEQAEQAFEVIESITNAAIRYYESNPGSRLAVSSDPELACAEIDFSGNAQNGRVQIDFGDGCMGPDGKTRKGIMVVEYEGHWAISNSEIYTVLKDFYVDDVRVEGTRILTNVSLDAKSMVYTEEIINGKITWPDNTYLTRISDRTHTLIFGDADNIFELQVEGHASGKTRPGLNYSTETIEPLLFRSVCKLNAVYLPVSGIKTIIISEKPVITVNYGGGDCDTKFTVSIDDSSKEVNL
jgi:hypothetical protein